MIPVRVAAEMLKVTPSRVIQLIAAGRIAGAVRDPHFNRWLVPEDFTVLPPKRKEPK